MSDETKCGSCGLYHGDGCAEHCEIRRLRDLVRDERAEFKKEMQRLKEAQPFTPRVLFAAVALYLNLTDAETVEDLNESFGRSWRTADAMIAADPEKQG